MLTVHLLLILLLLISFAHVCQIERALRAPGNTRRRDGRIPAAFLREGEAGLGKCGLKAVGGGGREVPYSAAFAPDRPTDRTNKQTKSPIVFF